MRTPLNVVIGMAHIASKENNPPRTADCLRKINAASRFLLGLINDVLDMAKAEQGKIELRPEPYLPEQFSEYIEAVVRPLCVEKGLEFVFDCHTVKDYIPLMDKLRSNQIFFNLVSNAVKFTPKGGTVTVALHESLTPEKKVMMELTVSDTGYGMSEEFQKKLFEPFTQEQRNDVALNRGTGLGLAIVKQMVDLMHGTIRVESMIGKGTTVVMSDTFDSIPVESYREKEKVKEDFTALAGKHILLCEDHPMNQEIAEALLKEKHMSVDIAADGIAGVSLFSRSKPGTYDAVLMDIRMPGLDGYTATKQIRGLDRSDARTVPIIAMTADVFADDVQKCLAAGMNGHIAKPLDSDVMCSILLQTVCKHGR